MHAPSMRNYPCSLFISPYTISQTHVASYLFGITEEADEVFSQDGVVREEGFQICISDLVQLTSHFRVSRNCCHEGFRVRRPEREE